MNHDWTDILRNKLAEHEIAPPAGLWEDIEAAMKADGKREVAPEGVEKKQRNGLRSWIFAAAACVALLVGFGILLQTDKRDADVAAVSLASDEKNALVAELEKDVAEKIAESFERFDNIEESPETPQTQDILNKETQSLDVQEQDTQEQEVQEKEIQEKSIPAKDVPSQSSQVQTAKESKVLAALPQKKQKSKKAPLALNLYAANLRMPNGAQEDISVANNSQQGSEFQDPNGEFTTSSDDNPKDPDKKDPDKKAPKKASETTAKHRRPLRLGLSLSYPLNGRLSLNGGVMFSRLSSDVTYQSAGMKYTVEKKQTNIGIPLGVTYRLLEHEPLSVYLTAGGMLEQCVSGEEKRPQWSVFGGAGVQVMLSRTLSLYAEPLVNYYPDNGSHIINIYKDKPTDFDVRVGLRWEIK